MESSNFIETLLTQGKVSVKGHLESFNEKELNDTKIILHKYYQDDILEMPYAAPEYNEEVALWAAEYLYKAVQLIVLRDVEEEMINNELKPFTGEPTPSVIYSADLMLRYLPQLFELAKGLAPGDLLVQILKNTARQWPYSSVGIELDETIDDKMIIEYPSLRYSYIDRIIQAKDKQRMKDPVVADYIKEVAGEQFSVLLPSFENS